MFQSILFILTILFIAGAYYFYLFLINLKRTKIANLPTPKIWEEILNQNFVIIRYIPIELKNELLKLIKVFISEKNFHGCGIEITEEIKITIAAQACLLLLNKKHDYYPNLKNIFIYPHAFKSVQKEHLGYVETQNAVVRSGESWIRGPIVLSWHHSLHGSTNHKDGQNVVFHEFAHQLDQEDGLSNGTPDLPNALSYKIWSKVMEKSFVEMTSKIMKSQKTIIDEYGATNAAEFFAVLTETFFEKPEKIYSQKHELYELLKNYYGLDPIQWKK